jgi:O-methyltransferase
MQSIARDHVIDQGLATPEELYLDLLKKCLTRTVFTNDETHQPLNPREGRHLHILRPQMQKMRDPIYSALMRHAPFAYVMLRKMSNPWPAEAETMIGLQRLDHLQGCITDVLQRRVPGDFIETGVWRGGAAIFMRAVLKAYGDTQRIVWAADSFRGLPKPDARRAPADKGDLLWAFDALAIPVEEVKANFARYGLLDDQVRFLVGWFRDTLPTAPIEQLAILRLDGDLYESTMDALCALYPKLSIGGYVIIDDYGAMPPCKAAVHDYRIEHAITEPIESIDEGSVFWRRLR